MQTVRFEIFLDVAGWLSRSTSGSDRVTVAAVAINSADTRVLRERVRARFPKWKNSNLENASAMVDLLCANAAGIAICSFVKAEPGWSEFWRDAKPLQDAIVREDRSAAGFVKPGNAARFALFTNALSGAMAYAACSNKLPTSKTATGLDLYERCIVSDSDFQGDSIEVFRHLCFTCDDSQPQINRLGTHWVTRSVDVSTEQDEPLLLLADFAAGIGHSAHIPDPGRIPVPVSNSDCRKLIDRLVSTGRADVVDRPFDYQYGEMFGAAYTNSICNP